MHKHNPIYLVLIMTLIASLACSIETSPPAPTEDKNKPTLEPSPTLAPPTATLTLVPTNTATTPATATLVVQAGTNEADLEAKGFIDSIDNKLRVTGKLPIVLNLKAMLTPPSAAPSGWEFIGPIFDITAQGKIDRKPIQKLAQALELRFKSPRNRPLTIMVLGEKGWEIVPSEFDDEGNIIASVDHLTPYGVGAPVQSKITPTAKPTLNVTATRTQSAATTRTPQATVVTTTVSSGAAETALSDGIKPLKNKTVRITSATGYTGVVSVALPASLQKTLTSVSASGVVYYGMYNGVNEAVTAQAKTGTTVSGAITLAIEPKTSMPATADDAKKQLLTYFPGVTVTLTQAQPSSADTKGYVFYGTSGTTAFSLGYVTYNGVALSYAMSGSGTYQSLVPKN